MGNPNWLRDQIEKSRIEAEKRPAWQREAIREDMARWRRESAEQRGYYIDKEPQQ